jgi:hypothetical protein
MPQAYDINEFINACGDPDKVTVAYDAKKGAEYFKIYTEAALLAFINEGGLENLQHKNKEVWHLNPHKPPDIMVDAYNFHSGSKYGYIAFMFIPKTGKWRIKSFKQNTDPDPRLIAAPNKFSYLPFAKPNNNAKNDTGE